MRTRIKNLGKRKSIIFSKIFPARTSSVSIKEKKKEKKKKKKRKKITKFPVSSNNSKPLLAIQQKQSTPASPSSITSTSNVRTPVSENAPSTITSHTKVYSTQSMIILIILSVKKIIIITAKEKNKKKKKKNLLQLHRLIK